MLSEKNLKDSCRFRSQAPSPKCFKLYGAVGWRGAPRSHTCSVHPAKTSPSDTRATQCKFAGKSASNIKCAQFLPFRPRGAGHCDSPHFPMLCEKTGSGEPCYKNPPSCGKKGGGHKNVCVSKTLRCVRQRKLARKQNIGISTRKLDCDRVSDA